MRMHIQPGEDAGLIIGKNGVTLDALEHLLQKIARYRWGHRGSVTLDVEEYKRRRRERWRQAVRRAIGALYKGRSPAVVGPFPHTDQREVVHALNGQHEIDWAILGRGFYRVMVLRSHGSAEHQQGMTG
jgi:spoIIIJ-associated protein